MLTRVAKNLWVDLGKVRSIMTWNGRAEVAFHDGTMQVGTPVSDADLANAIAAAQERETHG